jgi:succinate dehydrogenase / fumarate reductase membrane anchor subunit
MSDSKTIRHAALRSPLGRVRGLGSAKHGTGHWWAQRVTAIALVPLSLWFILSVIGHLGAGRAEMAAWIGHPLSAVLLLCLVAGTFHHMQLGLQVVIEDYIHTEGTKLASLLAMKAVAIVLALLAAVSILKLAF